MVKATLNKDWSYSLNIASKNLVHSRFGTQEQLVFTAIFDRVYSFLHSLDELLS